MPSKRTGFEWLVLVSCLIVLGGYILWSLYDQFSRVKENEEERLAAQARVVDVHVSENLAAIRRVLVNVRAELPGWQARADGAMLANQRLTAFKDALVGVRTLAILDAQGDLIASSRTSVSSGNFRDRPYFKLAEANPAPDILHISEPFTAVTGKWVIMVSMTLVDEMDRFGGLVVASLDPERFRSTLASVQYSDDMWSAVAHGDGLQFMMEPARPGQPGINLAKPGSFFTRHMTSGKPANVLSGRVYSTGESRVMALRTIQPLALNMDKPLVVAVGRDLKVIYEGWERFALFRLVLFGLLCVVSCIALLKLQRVQRQRERDAVATAAAISRKNEELERLNRTLSTLALVDGLTGIANRRQFDEVIDNEWRRCQRDQVPLAVIMIDIDYFKDYNDHYGHPEGDACLRSVAQAIKQVLARGSDFVARYGGEEFVCLIPKCDKKDARNVAESIRRAVEALALRHEYSRVADRVTISIGIAAQVPEERGAYRTLIAQADEALYHAKASGRNQVFGLES